MTNTIKIILTDAAKGTWSDEAGNEMVRGVRIPENRDYWVVAEALLPEVKAWLLSLGQTDALVSAIDPNGTDLGEPIEGGEVVCMFRLLDGEVEPQI